MTYVAGRTTIVAALAVTVIFSFTAWRRLHVRSPLALSLTRASDRAGKATKTVGASAR